MHGSGRVKNVGIPHWIGFIEGENYKIELITFSDQQDLCTVP